VRVPIDDRGSGGERQPGLGGFQRWPVRMLLVMMLVVVLEVRRVFGLACVVVGRG